MKYLLHTISMINHLSFGDEEGGKLFIFMVIGKCVLKNKICIGGGRGGSNNIKQKLYIAHLHPIINEWSLDLGSN